MCQWHERGGLVVVEAEVDARGDLLQRLAELEIGRRGVDRVAAEDDEQLDRAGVHVLHELAERLQLMSRRLRRVGVVDRRAALPSASFIACAIACTAGGWWSPATTTEAPRLAWRSFAAAAIHLSMSALPPLLLRPR